MGMDRNTVIGFVLLGLLLFAYLWNSTKNSQELQKQKQVFEDSISKVKALRDATVGLPDSVVRASRPIDTAGMNKALGGSEKWITVENDAMKIIFTNKGGQPSEVELKHFKSYDGELVKVISPMPENRISYSINTASNQSHQIADLYFSDAQVQKNADGSQTVIFQLAGSGGEALTHQYIIPASGYLLEWNILMNGQDKLLTGGNINFSWHNEVIKTQESVQYERQRSSVCFSEDNSFDYISAKSEKKFEKPVQWVSVAQQFFNRTLLNKNGFSSGEIHWTKESSDTTSVVGHCEISLQAKMPASASASLPLQLYFGPNDYYILAKVAPQMDRIVDLGRDFYSFVRPVNVYIIMPVFNFFKKFIGSYGFVIMLLTIFIRLLTSPLVYSSYLSGAKMKALRPEIDAMKKRVGNDQQQVSMEQMKLFREAGVNPLGGCIPALLQIPIFFALYSFFNSNIELRGQTFLWSKDLSAYDAVVNFGFNIPAYGSHVSLFALLAVVTSFLISLYGMNMTPDQSNPAMKYMPYIMPVMLLLFFNRLPSALTWYYTVSNVITLILQFVIQNYIIDHDKILAKLQENRNKPKSKPKWQERLEQMQETQKKVQQLKNKK
ncbi:MAG: membrane protein insertase YidC [Chitinophagales bacterium]